MRRAFTLLETMLAASIGSIVVLACVGIMYSMNRTDRVMEVRATERAALGRIRTVMERTFSSLLMSDEPQSQYNPEASDGEETGQFNGRALPRKSGGTPAAAQPAGTSGKDAGKSAQPADNKNGEAADGTAPTERREPKPPPPARMILGLDVNAPMALRYQPSKDLEPVEIAPQRLEVVLHRSPVPQATIDPLDMPLPPRSFRRNRSSDSTEADVLGGRGVQNVSQEHEGDAAQDARNPTSEAATEAEEAALPVRAIRGAFELHPQPPRGWRAPGIPAVPAPDPRLGNYEPTGLWELWWVPLLPPDSENLAITRKEQMFSGLGKPYFVAGDLKYARWTAFFRRSKRADLISTWTSDLPAYVELQVETASGLQSNWMFELDWASGPEVPKRQDAAATGTETARGNDQTATGGKGVTRTDRPTTRAGGGRTLGRPTPKGGGGAPSKTAPPPPPPGGKQ